MKLLRRKLGFKEGGVICRSSLICLSLPRTRRLGEEGPVKDPRVSQHQGPLTQSQKRRLSISYILRQGCIQQVAGTCLGPEMGQWERSRYHCKKWGTTLPLSAPALPRAGLGEGLPGDRCSE